MTTAFVIRPFEVKKDSSGKELDFERVHRELIGPALAEAGFQGATTTGEIVQAGIIHEDMFSRILEADLVVCDITVHNANVFYELGIRHALRRNRTVLVCGKPTADRTPFDLLGDRYLAYDVAAPAASKDLLVAAIRATMDADRVDSPVFQMLPALPPADPAKVQAVPMDFREEVDRAGTARAKGWLRLLADEVKLQRFQWPGLQLVADAQWEVKDYEGARESFEAIRAARPDAVPANLALANVYERLHRSKPDPALLRASDLAIERVLASELASPRDRVEALALKGRNAKTRWRTAFSGLDTIEKRCQAAMNQALRDSYQAYRDAFDQDLNHFYSGVAALQMGTIFLGLSGQDTAWREAFDDDDQADSYRKQMARDVSRLEVLISGSVDAAIRRLPPDDPERVWAQVSSADVLFLGDASMERVVKRYKDVIPPEKPFVLDAVAGQLQLFADLGIKPDLTGRVLAEIGEAAPPREELPLRVVVFAGHRVDGPGRTPARFPAAKEQRAAQLVREALQELRTGARLKALASAAPGGDIVFHEVCRELGIRSVICLPLRAAQYAPLAFENLDGWRSRFLRLRDEREVLELADLSDGVLPRWLRETATDPWERGNRWVLHMAMAEEAEVTLVALWDGEAQGDAPGGTAHMVQLARNAGTVHVMVIDTARLLD